MNYEETMKAIDLLHMSLDYATKIISIQNKRLDNCNGVKDEELENKLRRELIDLNWKMDGDKINLNF